MRVRYIGPVFDASGYADAARNNIAALHTAGVEVYVTPISFESFKSDLGSLGQLVQNLVRPEDGPPDVQICHCTPQHFPKLKRNDTYNIGYAAWETSKLPKGWADLMNVMDEIWVPSEYNVKVFKASGVRKPVYCFPHAFNMSSPPVIDTTFNLTGVSNEFVFYSIFQWLERKNPLALLVAYLTEFKKQENTVLVLKTYVLKPGDPEETENIRQTIYETKKKLYMEDYPRILLLTKLLSTNEVHALHEIGHCYVSLTRCEGFGLPFVEAMQHSKPVITTNYGAGPEVVIDGYNGLLVPAQEIPVLGMPWAIYTGDMVWASPDIMMARKAMRELYSNRNLTKTFGVQGNEFVKKNLSWDIIGGRMKVRLEQIHDQV